MPNESTTFFREFLRSPSRVGAVFPSSPRLASAVISPIPEHGDPVVVELGPGTGAFTRAIQQRLGGRGRHVAVEVNPALAAYVTDRFPDVEVVAADASSLPQILSRLGLPRADVVVSGLPWTTFDAGTQRSIVNAVCTALPVDGIFTTFTYLHARNMPPARRFRRLLGDSFSSVTVSPTVWNNMPPAFVYRANAAAC